jgi:hypothetical protein
MKVFSSIPQLINNLDRGKKLLSEMFGKRKSLSFRYDDAVEVFDQDPDRQIKLLIDYSIIRENGAFLEIDDVFLDFFSQVFKLSEEINVASIHENIDNIRQNIVYYLAENQESRKYDYLRNVKTTLRKVGVMTTRNVIDLGKKIDTTFKVEPNFKVKKSKLEHLDKKIADIELLIDQTQSLFDSEWLFFKTATDDELTKIIRQLRLDLGDCGHNLIENRKQIIDYLNQIKYKSGIVDKLRKLKYLSENLLIKSATDIEAILQQNQAVVFETRPSYPLKLSIDLLQTDKEIYESIKKIRQNAKTSIKAKVSLAGRIEDAYFEVQSESSNLVNLEEVKNSFVVSGNNLFDFVMDYRFGRELSFDEKVTVYCRVISLYDHEINISSDFGNQQSVEYALVYPQ